MDLQQARYFIALAEELNFSRAAARLNMSQPPLSRHIQQLEETLGVRLFDRTSRRVSLTPAGQVLLAEARVLLEQAERAVFAVRRAARAFAGTLTLGFVGAATYDFLPRMISAARAELPEVRLDLVQMETAEQEEALLAGRIDLSLSRPLHASAMLGTMVVARDPLVLVSPRQHHLAGRRRVTLAMLDGEPFIMFAPAARYLHDMLAALFAERQVAPQIVQNMTHSQAILSLVSAGIGLALVPQSARNASFDNVVFQRLDGSPRIEAELHAGWSLENRNPVLPEFRALLARLGQSI